MTIRSKKLAAILAAGALAAVAATSAYAYFTTSGAGSGSALAGSDVGVTVDGNPADGIVPGGSVPVVSTIRNASGQAQYVRTLGVTISIDQAHAADGCAAADFTYQQDGSSSAAANPFAAVVDADVPAHGTSVVHGTVFMADTAVSQDACKGATVQLAYAAS